MIIGNRNYNEKHTHIMGILNVTPDSFSDGGRYNNKEAALKHALEMINDGADIIDIGGESTRPGYIVISLDTYKSKVAKAGLASGADLINDIWGLQYDPEMASVIADANVACCLMHNRDIDKNPYSDFMTDYINDMKECVRLAHKAGISDDKIILDPGVGFGKDYTQNLQVIKHLDRLSDMGYPVLLGTSRKSVVGLTLDLPKDERVEGTVATSVIGALNHCMFVRVHDVKENYRAVKMTEAIMNS